MTGIAMGPAIVSSFRTGVCKPGLSAHSTKKEPIKIHLILHIVLKRRTSRTGIEKNRKESPLGLLKMSQSFAIDSSDNKIVAACLEIRDEESLGQRTGSMSKQLGVFENIPTSLNQLMVQ